MYIMSSWLVIHITRLCLAAGSAAVATVTASGIVVGPADISLRTISFMVPKHAAAYIGAMFLTDQNGREIIQNWHALLPAESAAEINPSEFFA